MEESAERAGLEGPREPENTGKSSLTQMEGSAERAVLEGPSKPEITGKSPLTQMEGSAGMEELKGHKEPEKENKKSDSVEKPTDDFSAHADISASGSLVTRDSGSSAKIQIETNTKKPETNTQESQTELSVRTIATQTGSDADDTPDNLPARAGDETKEPEKRTAIFCRDMDPDTECLVDHICKLTGIPHQSVKSYAFKDEWESQIREFHPIILLYSSLHSDMEEYLRHCTPTRDVATQQDTDSINSKESPAITMGRKVSRMIEMTSGNWFQQSKRKLMRRGPINIGIFSRSDESDYSWLVNVLQSEHVNVTPCYISNSGFQQFRDAVSRCSFGILYHTKNRGRINVTDVTDSLYNEELEYIHTILGKDKVIVVIDDLQESCDQAKDRILQSQTSISKLAQDLFLFTQEEKNSAFRHHPSQTNSNQPNLGRKLEPLIAMFKA
ncbi:uncharacterized protein [Hyperolius riggenbachi]|uniref:uncharacterized protein n=1 Tax=Hyperolius riggenbachi TaxID=752182 RepID=UPI0035A34AE3